MLQRKPSLDFDLFGRGEAADRHHLRQPRLVREVKKSNQALDRSRFSVDGLQLGVRAQALWDRWSVAFGAAAEECCVKSARLIRWFVHWRLALPVSAPHDVELRFGEEATLSELV